MVYSKVCGCVSPWVIYSCRGAPLNYARNYAYLHRVSASSYSDVAHTSAIVQRAGEKVENTRNEDGRKITESEERLRERDRRMEIDGERREGKEDT